jgi:hypothetical protein
MATFATRKTTTYGNDRNEQGSGGVAVMSPPRSSAAAPTHEQIAARAREIWQRHGRQPGRDQENWLEAERQLRAELKAAQR